MFRSNRRQETEITRFVEDTTLDVRNLRQEMSLARKLSFRRLDPGLKPPPKAPPSRIHYPTKHVVEEKTNITERKYPTPGEVSRLPSSRHFSQYLDEELDGTMNARSTPSTIEEDHSHSTTSDGDSESRDADIEIEIFPGVFKALRGSQETQRAWETGQCAQMSCFSCEADLAFVFDCELVICPVCKAVVPVEPTETTFSDSMPSLQSSASSLLSFSCSDFNDHSVTGASVKQRGVGLGIRIL